MCEPARPVFLKSISIYLKTNNHLSQDVVISTERFSLDLSACTSCGNFDISKELHEAISNCKSLFNEILNTPVIPIILESRETLKKTIGSFEVIQFLKIWLNISTPLSLLFLNS